MTPEVPRPLSWLRHYGERYPGAWRALEQMYLDRGRGRLPPWPDHVFVPLAGAFAVVSSRGPITLDRAPDIARVAALAAWRMTKGIYRFDRDLFDELWASGYEGTIPLEVLRHLPEWCVYVETPGQTIFQDLPLHGFFAFLEHDFKTGSDELYLVWDLDDGRGQPRLVHTVLHLDLPLDQALRRTLEEARANLETVRSAGIELPEPGERITALLERAVDLNLGPASRALSLLFFLIAAPEELKGQNADRPTRPKPKKTKRGPRLFAADGPRTWEVGWRLGNALRRRYTSAESGQGASRRSPRPHVRRAHWHGYWVGPKKDPKKRRLELRWLPPIPVGLKERDVDPLPAIVWRLRL